MKCYTIAVLLVSQFHCNTSFYHSTHGLTKRSLTSLAAQEASTAKKSAFYSKNDGFKRGAEGGNVMTKQFNSMKTRLVEEITKENVCTTQLESLLDVFKSAVVEKELFIATQSEILAEMKDVKTRVKDESILSELNSAILGKARIIEDETGICKEISGVSSSLSSEINETRLKIAELQAVVDALPDNDDGNTVAAKDYQLLLKSSVESSRSRDETVLELINIFDEATRSAATTESLTSVDPSLQLSGSESSASVGSSSTIARLTISQVRASLENKSNRDLATSAGRAVTKTAAALVTATASIFSATAAFIKSSDAKLSTDSMKSASRAVGDMGRNLKEALDAASSAWESAGSKKVGGIVEGVLLVFKSPEVKVALSLLSGNAQKVAVEAAKATEVASEQLGKSLKNSVKWKAAMSDLNENITLLLSILLLSSSRLLVEVRADLNKQLPNSK